MNILLDLIKENFSISNEEQKIVFDLCEKLGEKQERSISVIKNLIKFRLDFSSVFAYLVFETQSDNIALNDDTKIIYQGLMTQSYLSSETKEEEAEVIRKMFIAMSKDIRVVIIKLCIMLYDISLYTLPLAKEQYEFLIEVRDIFAPLAERLGLNSNKSELEDCCLKCLNPKIYQELDSSVMLQKDVNEKQIAITKSKLENIISELGLKNATIMARQKHYSSIYKKLKSKNITKRGRAKPR